MVCFFSTSVALKETEPMGEKTITNIMNVSVAGTSLKKLRKKFTNHCAGKTTVRKVNKAKIVSSEQASDV